MASKRQLLTERFAFSGGTVRRGGAYPVIEGVLLCGARSLNGRDYPPPAFAGDRVKRYEGKPVYVDHTDGRSGRKFRDKIGWVENVRHNAQGLPVGDIGLNPKHADTESVLWAAEHKPDFAGMSHVAACELGAPVAGRAQVADVHPESVDIVVDPATTKSFFENQRGRTVATTLRAVIEHFKSKLKDKRLKEARKLLLLAEDDAAMGAMMDAPVDEPAEGADPADGITAAFSQACLALVQQGLADPGKAKEVLGKLKEMFSAHAKVNSDGTPDTDNDPGTGGGADGDDRTPENKRPTLAGVLAECKAAGLAAPTVEQLASLTEVPSKDGRAAVIATLKAATEGQGAEKPKSTPRSGTTTKPAPTQESKLPSDSKDFAKRYRE